MDSIYFQTQLQQAQLTLLKELGPVTKQFGLRRFESNLDISRYYLMERVLSFRAPTAEVALAAYPQITGLITKKSGVRGEYETGAGFRETTWVLGKQNKIQLSARVTWQNDPAKWERELHVTLCAE